MKVNYLRFKNGEVSINFEHMTQGQAMGLCKALMEYGGPVVHDMILALRRTIQPIGTTTSDQVLYNVLNTNRNHEKEIEELKLMEQNEELTRYNKKGK